MMEPSSSQFNEEQLIKDLRALVADAEALLMATANTSGDKLAEIRTKAEASLRAAKVTMADAQVDVLAKAKEAFQSFCARKSLALSWFGR
jgi:ElaB/YqjD/DUF883 family membrane-anchored ribosome-binding protein